MIPNRYSGGGRASDSVGKGCNSWWLRLNFSPKKVVSPFEIMLRDNRVALTVAQCREGREGRQAARLLVRLARQGSIYRP